MIVRFEGFEHGFEVVEQSPLVVEIANKKLYARVCQSLFSEKGRDAVEPYSLWEGDEELKPTGAFSVLFDPFRLPWNDAKLLAGVYEKVESYCWEDDGVRGAVEQLDAMLRSRCVEVGLQMHADYGFGIEWDMRRYLKSFGFSPDYGEGDSLIDNLLNFLSFSADAFPRKPFLLVNFKTFFSQMEMEMVYERAFFLKIPMMLLENSQGDVQYENERKLSVDRDLLESLVNAKKSECLPSTQGGFCPTVLAQ